MLFLFTGFLQAQDFKQLMKEMRKEYEQSRALQVVMEIKVYDSAQLSLPYYQQTVDVRRDGNNYWYQVEENEMLLNEKYLVMVDKQSRQISYSNRSLQAEKELQKNFQFNLDSLLTQYETPRYLGKAGDAEHYLVKEKGPIEEIHFHIIPQGHILKKIEYKYREGQYVSIVFLMFDRHPLFKADTFSETRYVVKVNNKMVPSRFFKQYEIHYQ